MRCCFMTKHIITLSCCCLISSSLLAPTPLTLCLSLSLFGLYVSHCPSSQRSYSELGGADRLMHVWVNSTSIAPAK